MLRVYDEFLSSEREQTDASDPRLIFEVNAGDARLATKLQEFVGAVVKVFSYNSAFDLGKECDRRRALENVPRELPGEVYIHAAPRPASVVPVSARVCRVYWLYSVC